MKKSILLLIFLYTAGNVFPQCYFHKTYDYVQKIDAGFSIIQTSDGGYMSVGVSDEPIVFGDGVYAVKVDECGGTSWNAFSTLSPGSGGEDPWSVFEDSIIHSFLLFGNMYDPAEGATSSFILKLGANGDSIYHKVINHGYNDWCKTALKNNDNEFILGGDYNVNPPNAKIFLSKVDSLGNIIWQHDYGDSSGATRAPHTINKTSDGGYLAGTQHEYFHPVTSVFSIDIKLIKTDSSGNEQWNKSYRGINNEDAAWGYTIITRDGGYAVFGVIRATGNSRDSYLIKTDYAGNIQWRNYYDYNGLNEYDYFFNAVQLDDGTFIIGGEGRQSVGGNPRVRITKLSESGALIWDRLYTYYGGDSHDYIQDLIVTKEGDIAITGYLIPVNVPNNTQNDMFILKVDSCGYLENQNINADFIFILDTTNKTVSYTNQSTEYCTALWYFGDGDSTYQKNPTHTYTADGIYNVMLIVRAGNSLDTIQQQVVVLPVGIHQQAEENLQIKIYPNPAYEILNVECLMMNVRMEQVSIYDVNGSKKLIANSQSRNIGKINIKELSPGIYFYQVQFNNGKMARGKFVKQ